MFGTNIWMNMPQNRKKLMNQRRKSRNKNKLLMKKDKELINYLK